VWGFVGMRGKAQGLSWGASELKQALSRLRRLAKGQYKGGINDRRQTNEGGGIA